MKSYGIILYISCSSNDVEQFEIQKISELLEEFEHIKEVIFYQREPFGDIYEFMDKNLERSDILLLFCSENAKASEYVRKEWSSFDKRKGKVIPIFTLENHIPFLINTKLGVKIIKGDIKKSVQEIYNTIIKVYSDNRTKVIEDESYLLQKVKEQFKEILDLKKIKNLEVSDITKKQVRKIIHKYHQSELFPISFVNLVRIKNEIINELIVIGTNSLVVLINEYLEGIDELKDSCEDLLDLILKDIKPNWRKVIKKL
jgi:hypothetical protein